jgi:tetratricopeptide (TPR) repeat protein
MPRQKSTHVDNAAAAGRRLRQARQRAGLSQRALAFPGCSAAYISRVEAGERIPSLQLLRELARRLGVSESYLATGEDPPPAELSPLVDAELALRLGDAARAEQLYEDVLREGAGASERLEALIGLGKLGLMRGETAEAIARFEEALELAGGDPAELPALAESLGRAYADAGELAPAIALFERCMLAYEQDSDPVRYIRFACLLGYALTDAGDFGRAEQVIAKALSRGRGLVDPYTRARLYWSQSRLLGEQGKSEASARYARMALETLRVTEDVYSLALAHQLLAYAYLDGGRAEEAAEVLAEARPLMEATATPTDLAYFEIEEARAAIALGASERAGSLAMNAAGRLKDARPAEAGRAYVLLAEVYERLGERERAKELLELGIELLEGQPHTRYLLDAYRRLAALLEADERPEQALAVLKKALSIQQQVGRALT